MSTHKPATRPRTTRIRIIRALAYLTITIGWTLLAGLLLALWAAIWLTVVWALTR